MPDIGIRWIGVLLLVSTVSANTQAGIYQWRDENGKLHFSDKKPEKQKAKESSADIKSVNVDNSGEQRRKLGEVFQGETPQERAYRERQQAQQSQQKQQFQQRCNEAREYLTALQGRMYYVRDDGSTYDISEKEREKRASKLQAEIRRYCR